MQSAGIKYVAYAGTSLLMDCGVMLADIQGNIGIGGKTEHLWGQ